MGGETKTMYTELHCHTNYSFQEGASSIDEVLARAGELGYHAPWPSPTTTTYAGPCSSLRWLLPVT